MSKKRVEKVFVSGCFDVLHAGHIYFLSRAATYGELYVSVGSDRTVAALKGKPPLFPERERLLCVKSLRCVEDAFVAKGSGLLDFEEELRKLRPDIFVVQDDGDVPEKRRLCEELGIKYVALLLQDSPFPLRSSTGVKRGLFLPYRVDLAGGWLDQPFVSKYCPGSVIVASIEPWEGFCARSGLANGTRVSAVRLWGESLPQGDPYKLAKVLFACDNPPGTYPIAGSQDAIGIVFPGINRLDYDGDYWPVTIESVLSEDIIRWVESLLYLVPLSPRPPGFSVLEETTIRRDRVRALSVAAQACWNAILAKDARGFGEYVTASFEAQVSLFPNMVTDQIQYEVEKYRKTALGWKVSGAGGGGYLIVVSSQEVPHAIRIRIRRG
jgi:cytidyltransferase-like protein